MSDDQHREGRKSPLTTAFLAPGDGIRDLWATLPRAAKWVVGIPLFVLLGLLPVASGTVRILGQLPGETDAIAYVPQDYTAAAGSALRARDMVALGLTGTSWTWTNEKTENPAGRNRIQVTAVRDGLESYQSHDWYVDRAGLGNNLGNYLGGL